MKLLSARVIGFQSFGDSADIPFKDGINLIVGQNNSGKSALLRALQHQLTDDRHRTPERWNNVEIAMPEVRLTLGVSGSEFRSAIFMSGRDNFIPIPPDPDPMAFIDTFWTDPMMNVAVIHRPGNSFTAAAYPGHGKFQIPNGAQHTCAMMQVNDGNLHTTLQYRMDDTTAELVRYLWHSRMFFFSAERMNIGNSPAEPASRLTPNASNLPSVMLTLQGSQGDLFTKLVRHLRDIFSTVGNVSLAPIGNGLVEVRVWPTEAMERIELSFPLLQSGTGVAQVMAILTAVMTVENSIILIDEINSFLHPSAVKALLRILQTEYSDHQYIISTHAPEVIGFSNPCTVHLVKRNGYESSIHRLTLTDISDFRKVADHLGISMADVFAADRIVWVEGQTEELCFPLLYQQAMGQPLPRGTIFTSVVATGDFIAKRRDRPMIYQIYQRLSQAAAPLVNAVAFSFDSEELTDDEKTDMMRDSQGRLHFLPRRHIECYLVNAEALLLFMAERDSEPLKVDVAEIESKLVDLASNEFRIAEWQGNLSDPAWLSKVDAAKLLATACAELTDQRVTFKKKNDTLALIQAVQSIAANQLDELTAYVRSLVEAVT
ncbi:hypothetical protein NSE01_10370 [Novosphingobium sediminis]|uniref:ATPase AAA-type core domain-containing protein n=1 Tax=Novosphingobium sediminis TaxID=707214 RepID=A0A512AHL9_9SPHN|nr:AAA family ATPase [Novosphingobium sediminis]GEN99204.1 hypothetical protein NSE01_10370 [Novosphingobium sediminis]